MKQILFCYKQNRKLRVRYTTLTDVFIPTQDVISPQKSTLILPKSDKIELNDIVIIRDNTTGRVEYIGYIDTLTNKVNTEISCYPLINVFDNDYVLDQIFMPTYNVETGEWVDSPVEIVTWLTTQLERAFIDTDDDFQALPLIIRNKTKRPILYKKALDTANLFEVYTDIFVEKGVYIDLSELSFNGYEIDGIYCDIYCNQDEKPYVIREDYPQIESVDIVDNTFTNYNKIIATQELPEGSTATPQRYYFYLLEDNSITTDPNAEGRIKQVRSKAITFETASGTQEEIAKALILAVYNELQAPEYNLQITINMLENANIRLYRRVDFIADSGIMYSSNVTKIEKRHEKNIIVTLGALRNSLTDFKKKVEAI